MVMSNAVLYAVKRAIESARYDTGQNDNFILCKYYCLSIIIMLDLYFSTSCNSRKYTAALFS